MGLRATPVPGMPLDKTWFFSLLLVVLPWICLDKYPLRGPLELRTKPVGLLSLALLPPPVPGSSWSRVSFPPLPPAAAALPGRPPHGPHGGVGLVRADFCTIP